MCPPSSLLIALDNLSGRHLLINCFEKVTSPLLLITFDNISQPRLLMAIEVVTPQQLDRITDQFLPQ
jgi:hypothetical protein